MAICTASCTCSYSWSLFGLFSTFFVLINMNTIIQIPKINTGIANLNFLFSLHNSLPSFFYWFDLIWFDLFHFHRKYKHRHTKLITNSKWANKIIINKRVDNRDGNGGSSKMLLLRFWGTLKNKTKVYNNVGIQFVCVNKIQANTKVKKKRSVYYNSLRVKG